MQRPPCGNGACSVKSGDSRQEKGPVTLVHLPAQPTCDLITFFCPDIGSEVGDPQTRRRTCGDRALTVCLVSPPHSHLPATAGGGTGPGSLPRGGDGETVLGGDTGSKLWGPQRARPALQLCPRRLRAGRHWGRPSGDGARSVNAQSTLDCGSRLSASYSGRLRHVSNTNTHPHAITTLSSEGLLPE